MHIAYNTPAYRKLYRSNEERYINCDKLECIEERVRAVCAAVHASRLGVSMWSCEGHEEVGHYNQSYIMFMARNRESAMYLTDVFQQISGWLIDAYGWNEGIEIEHDLAMVTDDDSVDHTYPCLTIRNSPRPDSATLDNWWFTITNLTEALLASRIELQTALRNN